MDFGMSSPFEELEYLADHLPDEGEAVVVVRRGGELLCEPYSREEARKTGIDTEFYGRLVQANEQLNARGALPIWTCGIAAFWTCVLLHKAAGLGWTWWSLDVGLGLLALLACFVWIRRRQYWLYRRELLPMLNTQLRRRRIDRFALIGALRSRVELRTVLDQMTRTGE